MAMFLDVPNYVELPRVPALVQSANLPKAKDQQSFIIFPIDNFSALRTPKLPHSPSSVTQEISLSGNKFSTESIALRPRKNLIGNGWGIGLILQAIFFARAAGIYSGKKHFSAELKKGSSGSAHLTVCKRLLVASSVLGLIATVSFGTIRDFAYMSLAFISATLSYWLGFYSGFGIALERFVRGCAQRKRPSLVESSSMPLLSKLNFTGGRFIQPSLEKSGKDCNLNPETINLPIAPENLPAVSQGSLNRN